MKPSETRWNELEIALQRCARSMLGMVAAPFNRFAPSARRVRQRLSRAVLLVMLVGNGMAQAAETQEAAAQRPLDLSLPRATLDKPCERTAPGERCVDRKAYGAGYEARRANDRRGSVNAAAEQASSASTGRASAGAAAAPTGPTAPAGGSGRHGRR